MVSFSSQIPFVLLILLSSLTFNTILCCNEKDENLLLMFKQSLIDPSNRLSDWSTQQDCCEWSGIICDEDAQRVTYLDLKNPSQKISESFRGEINFSSLLHLEFLQHLDLSHNDFLGTITIPSSINDFFNLTFLDLSYNYHLHMDSLHWLSQLPSLETLILSGIDLHKQTNWLHSLASFSSSLYELDLKDCQLTNIRPLVKNINFSFSSLAYLDLAENDFNYELTNSLFNLSGDCYYLNLSFCGLRGRIPDLSGYQKLEWLILSNNELDGSIPDWLGQLDLFYLDLSHNLLHGSIPSSLGNLSASASLDISFNYFSGEFPQGFEQIFTFLGLSHNSISGNLSNLMLTSDYIFMAYNKFEGGLPHISTSVKYLDLSHNTFSGSLSPLLCHYEYEEKNLKYLDLSNNVLSGELPDCWNNWTDLSYIYFGNNRLTSEVPPSIGSLLSLQSLDLHNNDFFGHVPSSFQNCKDLVLINLERNNFFGSLPNWMPQSVSIVKLRFNQFHGNIPSQLCSISNLTILDLAHNNLSGSIPRCLYNLTSLISNFSSNDLINYVEDDEDITKKIGYAFKIMLYTKGRQYEYMKNLMLVCSIDLSSNKFFGAIPSQLFRLIKLQSLNLSYNRLTGKIPKEIGRMKDMESLDFSHNEFYGEIPESFTNLSFLSYLNLSFNNFSGQIPLGTQIQSLDAWSFIGNPKLCGAPLMKNCTKQGKPKVIKVAQENLEDDDDFLRSLYLGMGVGFGVGFWVVCGCIFFVRAWRITFFRFFDHVVDQIYVAVALKFRSFH